MQFLLFDFGATLVFLLSYLTVSSLRRRRALPGVAQPLARRRAWPRLSYPR